MDSKRNLTCPYLYLNKLFLSLYYAYPYNFTVSRILFLNFCGKIVFYFILSIWLIYIITCVFFMTILFIILSKGVYTERFSSLYFSFFFKFIPERSWCYRKATNSVIFSFTSPKRTS